MAEQNSAAAGDDAPFAGAPASEAASSETASSEAMTPAVLVIITVCSMLATLMQALDSTIANVALPYMQGTMAASQDEINWVLTSYIVSAAIMTAPVGFLTARFGRTRVFVTSIAGFTIASMLCGLAQSLDQIVIFRILQGVFGAALVPLSQTVLYDFFPPNRRGAAMALWGIGVQVGPVFGPILGGWLTQDYSWRWVFFVNVPFGIISVAGLLLFLKETPHSKKARIDWVGFAALGLGVGALQLMLDRGEQLDWFNSREIIAEACVAATGFYAFLVQSSLAPKPFISPKLFADVNYVVGISFIFIVGLTLYATLALQAPYLQLMMNYPVITAGLVLAPRGIGTMFTMLVVGQLLRRIGVRPLVGLGFFLSAGALYEMQQWTPAVAESTVIFTGIVQGISVGLIFVPVSTIVFATLPTALRTEATGIYSLMRNLGSAIGISVTGALLQSNTEINHADIAAPITAFNRMLQSGAAAQYWHPGTMAGAMALNQEVTRQATIISYNDDYKFMMVLTLLALPMVLLIRGSVEGTPSPSTAME